MNYYYVNLSSTTHRSQSSPKTMLNNELFIKKEAMNLYKAGFIDETGSLTTLGLHTLQSIVLENNLKQLNERAESLIKEHANK